MAEATNKQMLGIIRLLATGLTVVLMVGALASCNAGGGATESGAGAESSSGSSSAEPSSESASESSSAEEGSKIDSLEAPTDFTSEEARQAMLEKSADFPSKFDLRDVDGRCYVTPVRLQNPFGTCWGFAAIASAETNILGSVLADDPDAYKTLNLSEKQLAYFASMHVTDESSSQYGEGLHVRDEIAKDGISSEDIYGGGSTFLASNTFAAGIGPVDEDRDPAFEYHGANGTVMKKAGADGSETEFCYSSEDDWNLGDEYRYQQDYVLKEAYLLPSPAQFSGMDDFSFDDLVPSDNSESDSSDSAGVSGSSAAAQADYVSASSDSVSPQVDDASSDSASYASNSSDLSEEALGALADLNIEYSYNEAGTAAIKDQLLQKRAVTIGFHADTSKPWEDGSEPEYINLDTWAHYTWKSTLPNHAVTIVGWDDDYPAENFLAGHKPEADGAWLVKNSWGSGQNDFPDKGYGIWGIPVEKTDADGKPVLDEYDKPMMVGSGYFWLSYYDRSIANPEAFVFESGWNDPILKEMHFLDDDVRRHQYDLMPAGAIGGVKSAGEMKAANIFTAEEDEYLMCTSFEITSPGTTVDYEVYLLSPDYKSPVDGVLMASGQKTYEYGGYYMEFVDPLVSLRKGQSYSIVVAQHLDTGEYAVNVPTGLGKDSVLQELMTDLTISQYSVAVVNKGESMVYANGSWQDWSDEGLRYDIMAPNEFAKQMLEAADPQYDNFPVKGFAIDAMPNGTLQISGGEEELHLKANAGPAEIELEYAGDETSVLEKDDLSPAWKLASGGEELVTVEPSEDGFKAKVSGLKPGKTFLFVGDSLLGTTIIPVEIEA